MSKTKQIQIRLTMAEYERLTQVAENEYLNLSAWIRRTLLKAVDVHESGHQEQTEG